MCLYGGRDYIAIYAPDLIAGLGMFSARVVGWICAFWIVRWSKDVSRRLEALLACMHEACKLDVEEDSFGQMVE